MNKILLITKENCFGCNVMKDIITKAIKETKIDVKFTIQDYHDVDEDILKKYSISDYPTTMFIDNNIRCILTGTKPINIVKQALINCFGKQD